MRQPVNLQQLIYVVYTVQGVRLLNVEHNAVTKSENIRVQKKSVALTAANRQVLVV